MDKLLRPSKLEILPEEPEAIKVYDYWLKTFDSFLEAVTAAAENADGINKLGLLTNFLTHQTYSFIAEATTYDDACEALKIAHHKRQNVVFTGRLLMTRVQNPTESIDEYVHVLRQLTRDCEFQDVNARTYQDELTRDAFINGINSSIIRQRLLEEEQLDLTSAIKKGTNARSSPKVIKFLFKHNISDCCNSF